MPTLSPHRAILAISGNDRFTFLQGLITNDIEIAKGGQPLYACLLTAQGKFLHDFLIIPESTPDGEHLLLTPETDRLPDLKKRLTMYKLRSKVTVEALPDYKLYHQLPGDVSRRRPGSQADQNAEVATHSDGDPGLRRGTYPWLPDPRHPDLGNILITDTPPASLSPYEDYNAHRLRLGLPDGSRDMIPEKAILLENKVDQFNGISFEKGCYLGQELTARTHYRGLVRKHLTPVSIQGQAPEFDAPITLNNKTIGQMRSHQGNIGLALLRQHNDEGDLPTGELHCGETILQILT